MNFISSFNGIWISIWKIFALNQVGKFNVSGLSIRIIRYSFCLLKNYQIKYDACEYSRLSSYLAVKTVNRPPQLVCFVFPVLCCKRFRAIFGAKNEERESKTTRKMASRFISRAAKTKNPISQSIFDLKPNGNASYAAYPYSYSSLFINYAYICT